MRVITLLPAATEIVAARGGPRLVNRAERIRAAIEGREMTGLARWQQNRCSRS